MRFEALREALLKGGIAPRHVRRYLAELSEHLDDLTAEQRRLGYEGSDASLRARALLGEDAELAAAMLEQKSLRSLPARAPWAIFVLLPPVAGIAAAFLLIAPLMLAAHGFHMVTPRGINAPEWFRTLTFLVTGLGNLTLAPLLAAGFVFLAARQRLAMAWPVLAVLLVAVLDIQYRIHFPAVGQRGGEIGIGAVMWLTDKQSWLEAWPLSLARLLLTLLPAFWLFRKRTIAG
jgi:hypothetical protein